MLSDASARLRSAGSRALLRLDTDWYESTRHELAELYPRLERGGVLLIDDYGHFAGARKAVDEYFGERSDPAQPDRLHRASGRQGLSAAIFKPS